MSVWLPYLTAEMRHSEQGHLSQVLANDLDDVLSLGKRSERLNSILKLIT